MAILGKRHQRATVSSKVGCGLRSHRIACDLVWRIPAFEILEERAMLSVAQDLANSISRYQQALTTTLSVATQMPLVGHQLTGLSEFTTILQNLESNIAQQTQSIINDGHYQITVA